MNFELQGVEFKKSDFPWKSNLQKITMSSSSEIKQILKQHNIRPLPQLGQHFLINQRVKELFLRFAKIHSSDIIIEVGPGLGALTLEMAKKVRRILAIEKDKKLAEILKEKAPQNVTVIHQDILKTDLKKYLPKKYKLISDVPYNISSPLLELFLIKAPRKPELALLMLQKEFADRIVAQNAKMSRLSIFTQSCCRVKKIADIAPSSFWPSPSVKSSLVLLLPFKKPLLKQETLRIIKKCFIYKRKKVLATLKNILKVDPAKLAETFKNSGIDINSRPEDLTIKNWQTIQKFSKKVALQS